MSINKLVYATGDLIQWSFGILEALENKFNWAIIGVMSIMAIIWIKKMADFNREAKENGTLK
jgi:hypothetical protein